MKSDTSVDDGETIGLLAKSSFTTFSKSSQASAKPPSYGLDTTYDAESDLKHFGDKHGDSTTQFIEELESRKKKEGRPSLAQATLQGLKQNLIPGIVLQIIGTCVVVGYYTYEPAETFFNKIAAVKEQGGYFFSILSTSLFGGIIPYLILLVKDHLAAKKRRKAAAAATKEESAAKPYGDFIEEDEATSGENEENEPSTGLLIARFCFYAGFLGYKGMETDAFYRMQAYIFGEGTDFWTIFIKVVVDQFVWNPIYAAPSNTLGFMWKDCDFSVKRLAAELDWDFIFYRVPSVLCSTWLVWVPAVSLIYSLPSTLQIPLFNLVLCFFILILSFVSKSASS
ncbi:uncharacterized protein ACA1_253670 [Acanthamoeba castellanii str. Neff]|uniref:Mpv17 / PMP22 family protein n=1 Tax=Acanthamoeba castellanii (strain ATCC 30010 / Neff) TaxID=1257118 RepID=L8HAZ0_ACACF|nr:uncharacterized protein ACA1_253670 [Acanthamoeba castellanii str. Neff]ELR22370.1 hypothetical protein ACA1_253670 [Acanthamoeba castellanii str. Neff]